ncbi:MAG: SCO family protein [Anaerolineales bacterium]|nr:SCO family protein [Anaerolineales bacterium]MCA9930025.1 SCO family protein [Anaerolineales bacterium]
MMKTLKRIGLGILVVGTAVLLAACRSDYEFIGTVPAEIQPAPDFTLTGVDGPVSLSDFGGKYVFVYFGYTFCPDICPDTLSKLARVRRQLSAEEADQVQVIMISVDPDRDTPELLAEYVAHFDDSFVGLTGTKEEIDEAGIPYYLFYEKHDGTVASGYLIDHSSRAFLIDKNGNARLSYSFDTTSDGILSDVEWLLDHE